MLNSKEENGAKKKLQQQSRIDLKTVAQKIGASSGGEGGGTVGSTRTHCCCSCSFIGLPGNRNISRILRGFFSLHFLERLQAKGKGDRCHSAECTWAYRCTQIPTVIHHIVSFLNPAGLASKTKRQPNVNNSKKEWGLSLPRALFAGGSKVIFLRNDQHNVDRTSASLNKRYLLGYLHMRQTGCRPL